MKHIAILLLGHRDADLINAFIGQILSAPGEHGVFVHIDRKAVGVAEQIVEHPRVRVLANRVSVRWADITQVEAMLALMRAAVSDPVPYEVFTVRSGQDLAVSANWPDYFKGASCSRFSARRVKWDEPFAAWFRCRWPRFTRRVYASKRHPGRMARAGLLALAKHGIRIFPNRKRLPEGWAVYHGTQWVTLSRAHVVHVLDMMEKRPEIFDFFAEVLSPEERFFQTLVMNSDHAKDVIVEKTHFEEFVGNHPRLLGIRDLPTIDASGKPFARKFDPRVDNEVLKELLNRGGGAGGDKG